jgi:hypothetical protein
MTPSTAADPVIWGSDPPAPDAAAASGQDDADQGAYIEEVGRYFENLGWPRMAGRLVGALMIAEPREQSAADLASLLHASRGSISTTSRLLISTGFAERHTRRGDRRDYYRIKDHAWQSLLERGNDRTGQLRLIAEHGLVLVRPGSTARTTLAALVDLCRFLERELPTLTERWRRERAARERTSE